MAEQKILAGHAVRRLRRQVGLTQAAMAEVLAISPSYLNLVERNQRPVSATLLVRLAERFDFDPRSLAAGEPGGGAAAWGGLPARDRAGGDDAAEGEESREQDQPGAAGSAVPECHQRGRLSVGVRAGVTAPPLSSAVAART